MNHDKETGARYTHCPTGVELRNLLPFQYIRMYLPTRTSVHQIVYTEDRAMFYALLASWNKIHLDFKYHESPIKLEVQSEIEREAGGAAGEAVPER